jgi:hypothetical protein
MLEIAAKYVKLAGGLNKRPNDAEDDCGKRVCYGSLTSSLSHTPERWGRSEPRRHGATGPPASPIGRARLPAGEPDRAPRAVPLQ